MPYALKELNSEIQFQEGHLEQILEDAARESGYLTEELPNAPLYGQVDLSLGSYEQQGRDTIGLTDAGNTNLRLRLSKKVGPIHVPMMVVSYYTRPKIRSGVLNLLVASYSRISALQFKGGLASQRMAETFLDNISGKIGRP